jgi:hypothetical protein
VARPGAGLLLAGSIVTFSGVCIVLVRVFGVPDWGVLLAAGVGLIVLGLVRRFTGGSESR